MQKVKTEQIVNLTYLKDDLGIVQLAMASNKLLDLNQLNTQLGRHLQALGPEELKSARANGNISHFPIPPKAPTQALLDCTLFDHEQLYTAIKGGFQAVAMDKFLALANQAEKADIGQIPDKVNFAGPNEDLKQIHNAITQFTRLRIQQRLSETLDLPPLPEIAQRIIELRTNPNASPHELAEVVELDAGLAAQVLNWARSPFYGVSDEISNIEDAVVRVLGFDLVLNLALGLALGRTLSVPKDGPRGYTPYWLQSIVTATLCYELAKLMPNGKGLDRGLAYLCGLLHNFGFLILAHVFPPQFELINRHIEVNPRINRMQIEQHFLSLTREQIAAMLLHQWRMPSSLINAIRQQHNPLYNGKDQGFAKLLYVATRALRQQGFGDGPADPIAEYILDDLYLKAADVKGLCQSVLNRQDDFASMVSAMKR